MTGNLLRPYEEARDALLAALVPLPATRVALAEAHRRWLAADLTALLDLPPFDNSGMDGWAVRTADLPAIPARLRIAGRLPAGSHSPGTVGPGEAVRIFTGAPLPAGADAVVMQEDADVDPSEPGLLRVRDRVRPWENVRFRGEDIRAGRALLDAGVRLGSGQVALLAAQGIDPVPVRPAPRVVVVPTGSELVPTGSPAPPPAGSIFESNGVMLAGLVESVGGIVRVLPPVPDQPGALRQALGSALDGADLVVTVGGASVGELDLVQSTLRDLGGQVDLWRLALKPGKPFFFGRRDRTPVCGLPGNPVSAFVTAVLLVLPALRRLQGAADPLPPTVPGVLAEPVDNPGDRRHFVRVRTGPDGSVRPSGRQASHHLASLADADGLVDVPPGVSLPAGARVRVIRWD